MFIQNKYLKWYNSIIANANTRTLSGYKEKHHIIPKSLGGSNDPSNLVSLTAREHFICHYLLTKMTSGDFKRKMIQAFFFMAADPSKTKNRYINSVFYEALKIDHAKSMSKSQSGNKNSQYNSVWITNSHTGDNKKIQLNDLSSYDLSIWKRGRTVPSKIKPVRDPCLVPKKFVAQIKIASKILSKSKETITYSDIEHVKIIIQTHIDIDRISPSAINKMYNLGYKSFQHCIPTSWNIKLPDPSISFKFYKHSHPGS